jgi:Ras-related protein Rab-8A
MLQAVSFEEGETLAREYNIHFFETSAKQDMNVEKSFITIATDVKERLMVDGTSRAATGNISVKVIEYVT